jgi:hypothetical protein
MSDKSPFSWTYDRLPIRKAVVFSLVVAWFLAVIILYSDILRLFSARPWWEDLIIVLATVAVPILAWFELGHSAEANRLRTEANDLRREQNQLQDTMGQLMVDHANERNKLLEQIASNTQKPVTPAQRNADTLRKHIGACASVTEGQGGWPSTPLIAEVNEANIVTLFTPSGGSNPQATGVPVDCAELDIVEVPHGSCPLRLHVRRRYGSTIQLGGITRWENRNLPAATPTFNKGGNVYHATFSKPGSAETRSLHIYASADGSNSFMLEPSVGERVVGDNAEISRRFMLLEVNYRAAGFNRSGSGTGGSPHPLFIW